MEKKYLIDTNIIIYYLNGDIPIDKQEEIERVFLESFNISTIAKIELLGWKRIDEATKSQIQQFLQHANIYYVNEEIEKLTISIKQQTKVDTPDAIIEATALLNNLSLITRNLVDFKKIEGLDVYNPFDG